MAVFRTLWQLLVGVKDALVLIFLLLFFALVWALLSLRTPAAVVPTDGALLVALDGTLVDQATAPTRSELLSGAPRLGETPVADVLRAIDSARTDGKIKGLVLDLDRFAGGGAANLAAVGDALSRFRASGKPIHAFATVYSDDSYYLAARASDAWLDPDGAMFITGPGGSRLYFKNLLDRFKVQVEVFRVGTYKSAVEPLLLTKASEPARAADQALADRLWGAWLAGVRTARPAAALQPFIADPAAAARAAGDLPRAALTARLVDKLGARLAFTEAMQKAYGEADDDVTDWRFGHIKLNDYLSLRPLPSTGDGVGVVYVSGTIVDGEADAGAAGGDTVAKLILDALDDDAVKALVVRVDSPGGSVLASAKIRDALMRARAKKLPVIASFGPVAASGGYYVATAADTIYAQPETITGSIGVFGVLPTFGAALAEYGITTDRVATTPLSGQPDLIGGFNPQVRALLQAGVEDAYRDFIGLVATARRLPVPAVEQVAEGRVWAGQDALDRKLIDRFGTLDTAVAEARRRAGLPADARVIPVQAKPSRLAQFLAGLAAPSRGEEARDAIARVATQSQRSAAAQVASAMSVAAGPSIQSACLACAAFAPPRPMPEARLGTMALLAARLGLR